MYCLCRTEEEEQSVYRLEFNQRPWTTNGERAGNRWARAEMVKEWRTAFHLLTKDAGIPAMSWMSVTVEPHQKGGRLQDVGACNPAVKAAIDGIVDAGILPDDSPQYMKSLVFLPPQNDKNSLVLYIRGARLERDRK
jgi:crossover junction endodeoxyribonuclease RusA